MSGRRILFIDRDGTLIREPEDQQVDSLAKLELMPDVVPSLLALRRHGYSFVMVTNQDGLGTSAFPERDFREPHEKMLTLFQSQGISFEQEFVCPHLPEDACDCRKPKTGLLTRFLAATNIDTARSAVIGDRDTDLELATRLGVRGLLLSDGGRFEESWRGIVDALCSGPRVAEVCRTTKETAISITVNLDASGESRISTGIGFFDHMLEQIARHGDMRLNIQCTGDLDIDEHHTVEDVAICLGSAVREALGNKVGLRRYGFLLPMDESLARVAIDLSGRAAMEFDADFPRDRIGELSTEMVEHFFRSFAESVGAAVHVRVEGRNTHHMIEACFKAFGRALGDAVRVEGDDMPSTKGMLA